MGIVRHTVVQGEHISRIAEKYGFMRTDTIWMHPDNAPLRAARQSPNVLLPGDVLVIPDKQQKAVSRPTGALHTFVLRTNPLELRLAFLDLKNRPICGAAVTVNFGQAAALTTDGEGKVVLTIRRSEPGGDMALPQGTAAVLVGHLDPIDTESGVRARLSNLGYLLGDVEDADDAEELRFALQELQADYALPFTGELDDATRAKLAEVHGS